MNENTNLNVEDKNEEAKTAIYRSNVLMNKDFYYDFCSVSYNKLKELYIIFFCINTFLCVSDVLVNKGDATVTFNVLISICMLVWYLGAKNTTKTGYQKMMLLNGKEDTMTLEFFDDKIISCSNGSEREFHYHQITKFFETKNLILLHLQHNVYVVVDKNNLDANVDEVKSYLMEKCRFVKKKKFINCRNDKKWSLAFLIAQLVVLVLEVVAIVVLQLL